MLPLEGVRVVALEQAVAGPLCSRHLADLGADVVKIERPGGGDLARRYDTVVKGQATYFVWLNRGKRSIALDLATAGDREVLVALLARADVFVHNLGPGAIERLGFGWEVLHARWPRLISCAISGYGPEGPYRDRKAYDLLVQAESAVTDVTGTETSPAKVGISIADIGAGLYACTSILAALRLRDADGDGRRIDVSLFDCLAEWMTVPAYHQMYAGAPPPRTGVRHASIVPYGPYRCADGEVMLGVQNEGQWERLCRLVLQKPALADDPRFATNELRVRSRETLEPLIEEAFLPLPRRVAEERLAEGDVPFAARSTVADLVAHPQLEARGRWAEVATPGGAVRAIVPPFNIGGSPPPMGPVPRLDQHGPQIRREVRG
ncbi:MAG TPA: CaiB/BaiF CoA-transferase family protein [Candidatus Limnocylindria bacterium]|nr:CaiB/BaiF CoA-transferase family protein [Candidatus Limnocylindria bacterium]